MAPRIWKADISLRVPLSDDGRDVGAVIRLTLEKDGCTVVAADTAENSVGVAAEVMPDVVILDIMMPKISGFSALTALRGSAKTRDIPIAMMSGLSDLATVERAVEEGSSGYLTKPFSTEYLYQQLQTIIQHTLRPRRIAAASPGSTPA